MLTICIERSTIAAIESKFGEYLRALITRPRPDPRRQDGYRVAFITAFRERGSSARMYRTFQSHTLTWQRPDVRATPESDHRGKVGEFGGAIRTGTRSFVEWNARGATCTGLLDEPETPDALFAPWVSSEPIRRASRQGGCDRRRKGHRIEDRGRFGGRLGGEPGDGRHTLGRHLEMTTSDGSPTGPVRPRRLHHHLRSPQRESAT